MADQNNNCTGGSKAPSSCGCGTSAPAEEPVITCNLPPTLTFTCPGSSCEKPKEESKCEPKKEEPKCDPPKDLLKTSGCCLPAPPACSTNSSCGGPDNSCEVKPLSMTRKDGSSGCGPC